MYSQWAGFQEIQFNEIIFYSSIGTHEVIVQLGMYYDREECAWHDLGRTAAVVIVVMLLRIIVAGR